MSDAIRHMNAIIATCFSLVRLRGQLVHQDPAVIAGIDRTIEPLSNAVRVAGCRAILQKDLGDRTFGNGLVNLPENQFEKFCHEIKRDTLNSFSPLKDKHRDRSASSLKSNGSETQRLLKGIWRRRLGLIQSVKPDSMDVEDHREQLANDAKALQMEAQKATVLKNSVSDWVKSLSEMSLGSAEWISIRGCLTVDEVDSPVSPRFVLHLENLRNHLNVLLNRQRDVKQNVSRQAARESIQPAQQRRFAAAQVYVDDCRKDLEEVDQCLSAVEVELRDSRRIVNAIVQHIDSHLSEFPPATGFIANHASIEEINAIRQADRSSNRSDDKICVDEKVLGPRCNEIVATGLIVESFLNLRRDQKGIPVLSTVDDIGTFIAMRDGYDVIANVEPGDVWQFVQGSRADDGAYARRPSPGLVLKQSGGRLIPLFKLESALFRESLVQLFRESKALDDALAEHLETRCSETLRKFMKVLDETVLSLPEFNGKLRVPETSGLIEQARALGAELWYVLLQRSDLCIHTYRFLGALKSAGIRIDISPHVEGNATLREDQASSLQLIPNPGCLFLEHQLEIAWYDVDGNVKREQCDLLYVPEHQNEVAGRLVRSASKIRKLCQALSGDERSKLTQLIQFVVQAPPESVAMPGLKLLNSLLGREGDVPARLRQEILEGLKVDGVEITPCDVHPESLAQQCETGQLTNVKFQLMVEDIPAPTLRLRQFGAPQVGQAIVDVLCPANVVDSVKCVLQDLFDVDVDYFPSLLAMRSRAVTRFINSSTDLEDWLRGELRAWVNDRDEHVSAELAKLIFERPKDPLLSLIVELGIIDRDELEVRKACLKEVSQDELEIPPDAVMHYVFEGVTRRFVELLLPSLPDASQSSDERFLEDLKRFCRLERHFTRILEGSPFSLVPSWIDNEMGRCEPDSNESPEVAFLPNTTQGEWYVRRVGMKKREGGYVRSPSFLMSAGQPSDAYRQAQGFVDVVDRHYKIPTDSLRTVLQQWPQMEIVGDQRLATWLRYQLLDELANTAKSEAVWQMPIDLREDFFGDYECTLVSLNRYVKEKWNYELNTEVRREKLGPKWKDSVELADGRTDFPVGADAVCIRPILEKIDGTLIHKGVVKIIDRQN